MEEVNKIYCGDALELLDTFPDEYVNCCVTSPPYFGLRDYHVDGQIGLEETPELYVERLIEIFREVKRVLKKDGTLWLNLGDSYNGSGKGSVFTEKSQKQSTNSGANINKPTKISNLKPKDLIGIPWLVAFALRSDGWYLRQDIIWSKPNPMPESVTDRCTKSHEYIFLLSKSKKYYYNADSIKQQSVSQDNSQRDRDNTKLNQTPGRSKMKGLKTNHYTESNKRSVWHVATRPFSESHFAVYPQELIVDCIKAGCPENGIVLDPFAGTNTTGIVARKQNRNFISIELSSEYVRIAEKRTQNELGMFK